MEIRVSNVKFKRKPNTEGYFKIQKALKSIEAFKDVSLNALAYYLGEGHSVILAKYKKTEDAINSVGREYIESLQLMTLDVETEKVDEVDPNTGEVIGKKLFAEPLKIEEVEEIIYNKYNIKPILKYKTFSHTEEEPRARLIYYLEKPVTVEEYESMLKVILEDKDLKGRLDDKCKNANRIWQGTDKEVIKCRDYKPVSSELIDKLLEEYKQLIPQLQTIRKHIEYTGEKGKVVDVLRRIKLDYRYRDEIKQIINTQIDIVDFLTSKFGLQVGRRTNINASRFNCSCPIHNGSNEKGLAIYRDTNTAFCFGDCQKSYNIMNLGYLYYNEFNFDVVALSLMKEYGIPIKEEWILKTL